MNDEKNLSPAQLEAAISAAGDRFTLASVARALGAPRSDVLRRRLERFIESDNTFFHDKKWNCVKRATFFTGREFVITPDEWEITQGVLFPGHRFIPFLPDTVFPSEAKLILPDGSEAAKRKITLPLGQIFHYHLLLGHPQGEGRTLRGGSQIGTCRNPWAAAGRRAPSAGQLTLLQMLLSPGADQSLPQDEPPESKGPSGTLIILK